MKFVARNFAYQHPVFGRSKKAQSLSPYTHSVYYLWWEFLRRNSDYKNCCDNGGRGKLKSLYADFGDVHSVDFKTWWQTDSRGANLFAEQLPPDFKVIASVEEFVERDRVIFLQVPLSLPKRFLTQQFQKILNQHHEGRRGIRTNRISTAKYPITGHVDTDALEKCLRVYDMRVANPKMRLWDIAQKCKVARAIQFVKNDGTESQKEISDKKLILANTASRLLKRAEKIVAAVSSGKFPNLR
jgi:hypothetical protein